MSENILIVSDIHGSAYWCKKALDLFDSLQADKLLLLGDLLYHGPRNPLPDEYAPQQVISQLSAYQKVVCAVRGNCDSEVDQMVLPFPILADYALVCANGRTLFATHGHLFNEQILPPLQEGTLLLNGHFHVPCHKLMQNGAYYINCGSAALPKDGSPHSCILFKDNTLYYYDLQTGEVFDTFAL